MAAGWRPVRASAAPCRPPGVAKPGAVHGRDPGRLLADARGRERSPAKASIDAGSTDRVRGGPMSQSAADVVRGIYEAFGGGDVPAILAAVDENIDWRVPENLPHG